MQLHQDFLSNVFKNKKKQFDLLFWRKMRVGLVNIILPFFLKQKEKKKNPLKTIHQFQTIVF